MFLKFQPSPRFEELEENTCKMCNKCIDRENMLHPVPGARSDAHGIGWLGSWCRSRLGSWLWCVAQGVSLVREAYLLEMKKALTEVMGGFTPIMVILMTCTMMLWS